MQVALLLDLAHHLVLAAAAILHLLQVRLAFFFNLVDHLLRFLFEIGVCLAQFVDLFLNLSL